jgi:hypothetical protein
MLALEIVLSVSEEVAGMTKLKRFLLFVVGLNCARPKADFGRFSDA